MEVRRRMLEKAADGGWLDPAHPVGKGVANKAEACKDPEERYMRVFRGMWKDEELHRLRVHPNVLALFERIFGEPVLAHPMFIQRNIFPQTESFDFTTGAHQDKVHIGGATNHALWAPLGDCPLEKGALAVAAGSHKRRRARHQGRQRRGRHGYRRADPRQVGDGRLRGGRRAHLRGHRRALRAAQPHGRDQAILRRPLPAGKPGGRGHQHGALFRLRNAWEEVYADWSSDRGKYFWRALSPTVVPLDRQYYERRDRMAFDMAAEGDPAARDALLRIVQRDPDEAKRRRAEEALRELAAMTGQQESGATHVASG